MKKIFQLISDLHEKSSIIFTSNKGFEKWVKFLGDASLNAAIQEQAYFKCDIISLEGKSYCLEHRNSYLNESEE